MKSKTLLRAITFSSLLALLIVVFFSCNNTGKNDSSQTDSTAINAQKDSLKNDTINVRKFEYPIPTPIEVSKMLNKAGASYILGLANPLSNADKYITENKKALNLGVYGSDLSYASTYHKTQETREYLAKVQKLTDELGIRSSVNQELVEKVEKNINNLDSLHTIIKHSYYDTFDLLNQNGKGATSVLVLAGGWTEGIYVSTQLVNSSQNKEEIIKGIAAQKTSYDELIVLMRAYQEKNQQLADIFKSFEELKDVFNIKEGASLDQKQLKTLSVKIETLRNKIID